MLRTPLVVAVWIGVAAGNAVGAQNAPAKLTVTSPAFLNGEPIPVEFTADGRNISPPCGGAVHPQARASSC